MPVNRYPHSRLSKRRFYAVILGAGVSLAAFADTRTFGVSSASTTAGSSTTTMNFLVTRSGDTSYAATVAYHTADGSAVAGTDYTAANGTATFSIGASSTPIPIAISANNSSGPDRTFQLILDSASGPDFSPPQSFAVGQLPGYVTSADINGDGKPDLVVPIRNNDAVSVLLNNSMSAATASFATQKTFSTDRSPQSAVSVDINGDGKPDLITVSNSTGTISVLFNTTAQNSPTANFASQQSFTSGFSSLDFVAVADINGDGKPDLVVLSNPYGVAILLNATSQGATTPSFLAPVTLSPTNVGGHLIATDLNGDGKPDLILEGTTLTAMLNTTAAGATTPSFSAGQTIFMGAGSYNVETVAADINVDGKPDLLIQNGSSNTVSVLLNTTGAGATTLGFTNPQAFAVGLDVLPAAVVDINGDGKPDLIVISYNSSSVLLNTSTSNTTLSFSAPRSFYIGRALVGLITADLNNDGMPDLIAPNQYDASVSTLLNARYQTVLNPASATGTIHYPAASMPTVAISVNPSNVTTGQSATLSWSSTNSTSCSASNAWNGAVATSGSQSISQGSAGSYTYSLTCMGAGGSASNSATLTVANATPAPTATISASPSNVTTGQNSTLNWSSTNATSCTASNAWSGTLPTSGSQSVSQNSTGAYTYSLTCTGTGGSASSSATLTVNASPSAPTATISTNPSNITTGQSSTLNWSSTNASSCSASNAWNGSVATSGSQSVTPTSAGSYTHTLTCTGAGGTASNSATLTVTDTTPAPVVAISVNPSNILVGQGATLSWSSTNATSCSASNAWAGSLPPTGSQTTTPGSAGSYTYTLTCTGAGGSGSNSVTLLVNAVQVVSAASGSGKGSGAFGFQTLLGLGMLAMMRRKRVQFIQITQEKNSDREI